MAKTLLAILALAAPFLLAAAQVSTQLYTRLRLSEIRVQVCVGNVELLMMLLLCLWKCRARAGGGRSGCRSRWGRRRRAATSGSANGCATRRRGRCTRRPPALTSRRSSPARRTAAPTPRTRTGAGSPAAAASSPGASRVPCPAAFVVYLGVVLLILPSRTMETTMGMSLNWQLAIALQ